MPTPEELHQAALDGNGLARDRLEMKAVLATRTHDLRDKPSNCHSAEVHEEHDYEREVWSEPRWANPRSVWQYHCPGVRDETPYPKRVDATDRGVSIWQQDECGIPTNDGQRGFPFCRRVLVTSDHRGVHFGVDLWKKPPREWPPGHMADVGAGVLVSFEDARKVRDFLNKVLEEESDG